MFLIYFFRVDGFIEFFGVKCGWVNCNVVFWVGV